MQIDDVIREIVTLGIPEDAERLKMMIVILGKYSQIEDNRVRLAIWRLRQNLMQIVMIGNLSSQKARDDDSYQKQTDRWG